MPFSLRDFFRNLIFVHGVYYLAYREIELAKFIARSYPFSTNETLDIDLEKNRDEKYRKERLINAR